MNDFEAVRATLSGDACAFSALVERYRRPVYALANHLLQDAEEASDAAQEAFITAFHRLDQLRDPAGFGAWLRTIAANVCRMKQRSRRPTAPLEERIMSPAETDRWATRLTVRRAMACLSEEAQLTLSLYYGASYSVEEIGRFLCEQSTTIKSRLRNARDRLRKELDGFVEEALVPEPLPADFDERVLAVIRAARVGDRSAVETLVEAEPRLVDARDSLGNSPLVEALNAGNEAIAEDLRTRGAAVDVWSAASSGDLEAVRKSLRRDPALAHAFSPQGFTALHLAAHFGHVAVVSALLDAGADPNVVSRHPLKVTALHAALFGEQAETAMLLLNHGADPHVARRSPGHERDGWTPLDYARAAGMTEIVERLQALGAGGRQKENTHG